MPGINQLPDSSQYVDPRYILANGQATVLSGDVNIVDGSGNSILFIDESTQRVGIGTASPGDKLDVYDGNIRLTTSSNTLRYIQLVGATTTSGMMLNVPSGNPILFGVNGSEKFRLSSNGYVGINETNPLGELTISSTTSGRPILQIKNTNADDVAPVLQFYKNSASPADDDNAGEINVYSNADDAQAYEINQILFRLEDATAADVAGGMYFSSMMDGTLRSWMEFQGYIGVANTGEIVFNQDAQDINFRVESASDIYALFVEGSSGYVGIGQGTPTYNLDVTGKQRIYQTTNSIDGGLSVLSEDGAARAIRVYALNDATSRIDSGGTGSGILALNSAGGGGKVGIGTASPDNLVHIYSTTSGEPRLKIHNENNDAVAPSIHFQKTTGSAADDDNIGEIDFYLNTDRYAFIRGRATDVTGGDECGGLDLIVRYDDVLQTLIRIGAADIAAGDEPKVHMNPNELDVNTIISTSGKTNALFVEGSSGNVGIGTSAPENDLDVLGTTYIQLRLTEQKTDATLSRTGIVAQHYTAAEEPLGLIMGRVDATTSEVAIGGYTSSANSATTIGFYTASNNTTVAGTVRMTIDGDGDVDVLSGQLGVGVADTTYGQLSLHGDSTTQGGLIVLFNAADYDGHVNGYQIQALEGDLLVGPTTDTDAMKYDSGTSKFIFSVPVEIQDGKSGWVWEDIQDCSSGATIMLSNTIPSWASEIQVLFDGVSTDTVFAPPTVMIGPSGGVVTAGYQVSVMTITGTTENEGNVSTGFSPILPLIYSSAARAIQAEVTLKRFDPDEHLWRGIGTGSSTTSNDCNHMTGYITLAGALTQVQLIPSTLAGNFDAGRARVRYR